MDYLAGFLALNYCFWVCIWTVADDPKLTAPSVFWL